MADISYLDINADAQRVGGAHVPWSLKIRAILSAILGNIVVLGAA